MKIFLNNNQEQERRIEAIRCTSILNLEYERILNYIYLRANLLTGITTIPIKSYVTSGLGSAGQELRDFP